MSETTSGTDNSVDTNDLPLRGTTDNNSAAPRDFTQEDELSDLTLVIEGTKLYVHKQYLAEWSPVWRRMFLGGFIEQNAQEIPLPGKRLDEFTELLHCIYSSQKPISENNVRFLLELAEEYQMERIKHRCEEFLINQERTLEMLYLANKFGLRSLYRRCVEFSKTKSLTELEKSQDYTKLDSDTKVAVLKAKAEMLRDYAQDLAQREMALSHDRDTLTMERDNMKASLQAIHKIWDTPNKRCYRHITNSHFDFSCADCNENMYREVRALCGRGQHLRRYFPPH